ncbi:metal-dependent transcriptional regulator [Arcanobacterium bovis]|uniref:Metal-dependent transcriptional regulator n=1 Tax=Arcanobacterium bovis TaxID=2529275 RepID=A0A4Q9V481_9ACTO|nr:metal-dependent transcriptional regulator [Arcanobacterium bovis]TBW23807.1 metal-dependent transcriptional regulator [Arcanobacterium bovis]
MSELIDTTEMYLKTVYELEEEGIPALRARIVERLGQSGPTVSETVARMERDGLVEVGVDRRVRFTEEGLRRAAKVMRRHRLVERLLRDVIMHPWAQVHDEACRWEHVVSDDVANRIEEMLTNPQTDPFGNPIPTSSAFDPVRNSVTNKGLRRLSELVVGDGEHLTVTVERIAENVQADFDELAALIDAGVVPGAEVDVRTSVGGHVLVRSGAFELELSSFAAQSIFVA